MYETIQHGKTKMGKPEKEMSQVEARDLRLEKGKEKTQNNTKEKQQGFIQQFNGQLVKVNLVNGEVLSGKLHTDTYNRYEYLLEEETLGTMVIRKEAVSYIRYKEMKP